MLSFRHKKLIRISLQKSIRVRKVPHTKWYWFCKKEQDPLYQKGRRWSHILKKKQLYSNWIYRYVDQRGSGEIIIRIIMRDSNGII